MAEKFNSERAFSGSWGEVWINGEKFAEIDSFNAKINLLKDDVPMCGTAKGSGKKTMGWEGVGSLSYTKVDSRLLKMQLDALKQGQPLVVVIVAKLDDPAVVGHERISVSGVQFDDITLMNWAAKTVSKIEKPFTFDDYELLDAVA